jgi:hypothetical protein
MVSRDPGSRGSRHRNNRTVTSQLRSDASRINPATQTFPVITGGYAQSNVHGSWNNTSQRVESIDGHGGTWAADFHAMSIEATVSDDGYESSVAEPNTNPGYNPHGYTNISPALLNSHHLGVDGLAPGSPSSLPLMTWTEDTRSDSWMGDSSQINQSFGQETTSMGTSNGFYPGSFDGRDEISPTQDVSTWGLSQQFQLFTEYDASPLRAPVSSIPEFQGIRAVVRGPSSQPWSSLQPQQYHHLPSIVVSEYTCSDQHYPNPSGFPLSHPWADATTTSTPSIGRSEQTLTSGVSRFNADYPEVNSHMSLSTDFGGSGSRDLNLGTMLQEFSALSYPPKDEFFPRSV